MKAIIKKIVPVNARRFVKDAAQIAMYAIPNGETSSVPLSPKAQTWLERLKQDGIVKIENDPAFERVADYVDDTYFRQIESDPKRFLGGTEPSFPFADRQRFVWDTNEERFLTGGTEISCCISFRDPGCAPLFLDENLCQLLARYYRRQPYYRNQPLIQKIALKNGQVALGNGFFHVDHLHQVSIMLLVSDVTERDTHMEYCEGSHKRNLLSEGVSIGYQQCEVKARDYPIFRCTGKKGSLFVFDTSGFHRANYLPDSCRKILHLNINTGHHLDRFIDGKSEFSALDAAPIYVKRMFKHLNPT